jgi:preprotein translocase SecE subunit
MTSLEEKKSAGFWAELRDPYREGQGAFTRRVTYWVVIGFAIWAAFDLWKWMQGIEVLRRPITQAFPRLPGLGVEFGWSLPVAALFLASLWVLIAWYLKRPWLADMFIETEAEMKRVSWPAPAEAWGATKVVAVTVLAFTLVLVTFDLTITYVFKLLFNLEI